MHVEVERARRIKRTVRIIVVLSGVAIAVFSCFFLGFEWYFAIAIILISIFFAAVAG